jgi:hypothetical protein
MARKTKGLKALQTRGFGTRVRRVAFEAEVAPPVEARASSSVTTLYFSHWPLGGDVEIEVWQVLRDGGALAVLALAILGILRRWWVPGWLYVAEQERSERLERLAWSLTNATEKAVESLEQQRGSGR